MLTRQEFFNKVGRHLLTQNRQAMTEGSCMYRAPNGDRCAAGVAIPDDLYDGEMEMTSIDSVLSNYPELEPFFPSRDLATALQQMHDNEEPRFWRASLRKIAEKFDLNTLFLHQHPLHPGQVEPRYVKPPEILYT